MYALMVMRWLRDRLKQRRSQVVRSMGAIERSASSVDAKAEGYAVAIGDWAPHHGEDGQVDTSRSRWFSVTLSEKNAPWAFVKRDPSRTIASLELLTSLVGLILLSPKQLEKPGVAGTVAMTGFTDSQVSSSVITKGMTGAYPLCVVAMEMAARLERRGIQLFLGVGTKGSKP